MIRRSYAETASGERLFKSGRPDSNRGPRAPKARALTRLRHAPSSPVSQRIEVLRKAADQEGNKRFLSPDKGKPFARTARKATGLTEPAGLPKDSCCTRHVGSTREPHPDPTRKRHGGRAVHSVHKIFTRLLPVAAVGAGLLVATPVADAAHKAKKKDPIATIALGDKRP